MTTLHDEMKRLINQGDYKNCKEFIILSIIPNENPDKNKLLTNVNMKSESSFISITSLIKNLCTDDECFKRLFEYFIIEYSVIKEVL